MKKYQEMQILDVNLQRFRKNGIFKKRNEMYSDADLSVLFCIKFYNGKNSIKLTDVAKKLDLTLPAITHKVNDLEIRGLLKKSTSENDKRIINIELTSEIDAYLDTVKEEYYRPIINLSKRLTDDELITLNRLIEKANNSGKF